MPTLLLSTWRLPAAGALARAARRKGWRVFGLDRNPDPQIAGSPVFYGGSDVVVQVAERFNLALLEPPFDLLARTPYSLRLRAVEYGYYDQLRPFAAPTFVKPADVRRKAFDAGLYRDVREARLEAELDPEMPVLISEPVEWVEEYRCFILEGKVAASSPYLWYGRPVWRPYSTAAESAGLPDGVREVCHRLLSTPDWSLPPAFVVDVGLVRDRGWAVVEYNPAWCSSLLGCDPNRVLPVLERACLSREILGPADREWVAAELPVGRDTRLRELRLTEEVRLAGHAGAMT